MNIFNLLAPGLFLRLFSGLMLLLALAFRLGATITQDPIEFFAGGLIVLTVFYLYINVIWRVLTILNTYMVNTLPEFYKHFRGACIKLLAISLLPCLILLPNPTLVACIASWQLFILLMIALAFRYSIFTWLFYFLLIFNVFIPDVLSVFNLQLSEATYSKLFYQGMAYLLPVWALAVSGLLYALDKIKVSKQRLSSLQATFSTDAFKLDKMVSVNFNRAKQNSLSGPNKRLSLKNVWCKLTLPAAAKSALQVSATLSSNRLISKPDLLAIASGSYQFMPKSNLVPIVVMFIAAVFIAQLYPDTEAEISTFLLIFSHGGIIWLAMSFFISSFAKRKKYLARLRLSPLFSSDRGFNQSLLLDFGKIQLKAVLLSLTSATLYFSFMNTWSYQLAVMLVLSNLLAITLSFIFLIWYLRQRQLGASKQIVLSFIVIASLVICSIINYFQPFEFSAASMRSIFISCLLLLSWAVFLWHKKGINWQVA